MSFNLKKHAQMNLGDKNFDPSQLEGANPIEKAGYVGEFLDKQIGNEVEQGNISVEEVYGLLGQKQIGHPNFPELDKYRKDITDLRNLIKLAILRNGGNPNDEESVKQAIGSVIQKVLQRIDLKFIPKLIEIYSSSTRTEEKMKPLMDVSEESIIPSIRAFLSQEVIAAKQDVLRRFTETKNTLESSGVSLDDILTIINSGLKTGLSLVQEKYSPQQLELIENTMFKLNSDITNMPNRYWNRVISLHRKLPKEELEKWAKFQFTPVEWNLKAILREAGFDTGATKLMIAKDAASYFYPDQDDSGKPFENDYVKKQYALSRLKQLIENDYNNVDSIRKVMENTIIDPSDNVGHLLQVYFRSTKICDRDKSKFFSDLDAIGLSSLRGGLQEETYIFEVDKRYGAFNLVLRSAAERKLLRVFREKFNLDPVPFDFTLPAPSDCPTNEASFKIDFMLPADTLEGFEVDENLELTPIVRKKVLFVGEYFGEDRDVTQRLGDKQWLNPDGSQAYYIDTKTGEKLEMKPGIDVPVRSVYSLRSRWKVATTEALGHLIGSDSLSIKRTEISSANSPSLFRKLDSKNIIYLYEGGTPKEGCKAIREMIDKATFSPITIQYANAENISSEMNSKITMMSNIIDCQIVNIKMSEGLLKAKMEFLNKDSGYYRQAVHDHNLYVRKLYIDRNNLMIAIQNKSSAMDRDRLNQIVNKISEISNEIITLKNSPLKEFKDRMDEIVNSGEIASKISKLQSLKQEILSGNFESSIENLKVRIDNIKSGIAPNVMAFNNKKCK
jgi:hypothetical protein